MLKKFLSLFLCLVLLLSNLPVVGFATEVEDSHDHTFVSGVCACGAVQISATTFPDANFRAYITSRDYGADGVLSSEELSNVTSIDVSGQNIKNLTGVGYFTALTELYCQENQLTSLDVSQCTALTSLTCYDNQLKSLDVRKCTQLQYLHCGWNKLKSLDVSMCTGLTELSCEWNQLTSLDVSECTMLMKLSCYENQLASLDVSKCTGLTELSCEWNQLTSLDVSGCTGLTKLSAYRNKLTKLDVSQCTALTYLACEWNQLTGLDVSKCAALKTLDCSKNQLTSLNVSGCAAMETLCCYDNQLASLDVRSCTALLDLNCTSNQLMSLDVQNCTALTDLYCYSNQLKSLDVRNCTALKYVSCYDNQLTSLDMSNCTALTYLVCESNSRRISVFQNRFDLSNLAADGFDITKASNWQGGTVSGNILTATADKVTYTYNLGKGRTETFTLVIDGLCNHSWADATCTAPETCTLCGDTKGEAKGHNWQDATCTAPKTCTVCGATEGEKLPHSFDQEKIDDKYLVGKEIDSSLLLYKKSCKCGEAGEETFKVKFKDVSKSAYFYDAAMWAVQNGITTGTGDGTTFEPNKNCTRGQVVTFLWRAAGEPEPKNATNPFKDVKTSDYFYKAVLWASEKNITTGTKDGTTFEPNKDCNRAQIVTFLSRAKNGQPVKDDNPFKDVPEGAYYYNSVLWAVENGITTGTKDGTTFEPNNPCTRGQVITFLWRAYTKST